MFRSRGLSSSTICRRSRTASLERFRISGLTGYWWQKNGLALFSPSSTVSSLSSSFFRCRSLKILTIPSRRLQSLKYAESEHLERFSGRIVKIFRRLSQGFARHLDQTQHGKSGIGQSNPNLSQAWQLQIMAVFLPPAVFHKM